MAGTTGGYMFALPEGMKPAALMMNTQPPRNYYLQQQANAAAAATAQNLPNPWGTGVQVGTANVGGATLPVLAGVPAPANAVRLQPQNGWNNSPVQYSLACLPTEKPRDYVIPEKKGVGPQPRWGYAANLANLSATNDNFRRVLYTGTGGCSSSAPASALSGKSAWDVAASSSINDDVIANGKIRGGRCGGAKGDGDGCGQVAVMTLFPGEMLGDSVEPHSCVYILVTQGLGEIQVGNSTFTCEAGGFIVVPAGVVYDIRNPLSSSVGPLRLAVIYSKPQFAPGLVQPLRPSSVNDLGLE